MNTAKFQPQSFKKDFPNLKYLPELDHSFPIPNEILEFMDCIVSTRKKENDAIGKNHINLSEVGFKILLTMLALRNPFNKYPMTLKNIEWYCKGYSKKSIREAAKWLVKKGLVMRQKGKYDMDLFQVNYTGLSYNEIATNINEQKENCISPSEIIFKGIRELTTPEFKKEGDGKHTDNFTLIKYFLPEAKRIEKNGEVEWEYKNNPLFDSIDGNSLKVILKLAYLQNYNVFKNNNPLTPIKIETLMKCCGVSRNKIIQSIHYLESGGFLRSYKGENRRKCKKYIFNFRSYRKLKIQPELKKRMERELKKQMVKEDDRGKSFPVSGLHNIKTVSFSEYQKTNPFPSRDDYNKNLNLNKIKEGFKKDENEKSSLEETLEEILKKKERREEEQIRVRVSTDSFTDHSKQPPVMENFKEEIQITENYRKIKVELLDDRLNKKIDPRMYETLNLLLNEKQKNKEELISKDELVRSYLETLSIENRELINA